MFRYNKIAVTGQSSTLFWKDAGAVASNGRKVALAFLGFLWHKTAVPIFLERFILPLFAASVVILAITNPMKFDAAQRVTGTLALIFAAYFIGHTVYESNRSTPAPAPDFATVNLLTVVTSIPQGNVFWGLSRSVSGQAVWPIDCLLWLEIAAKGTPITLNYMSLEIKTENGWMPLRRLPGGEMVLYMGSLNQATPFALDVPEIFSFFNHSIDQWRTVIGFSIYQYTSLSVPLATTRKLRVTLTDASGQTMTRELEAVNPPDPSGSVPHRLNFLGNATDLSSFALKR